MAICRRLDTVIDNVVYCHCYRSIEVNRVCFVCYFYTEPAHFCRQKEMSEQATFARFIYTERLIY